MQNEISPDVAAVRALDFPADAAFVNRWSPRAFSPEPIDEPTLMTILEAARWAASSYNEQPWRFLLARTEADRETFLDFILPFNRIWAETAPIFVLVIAKKTFSHNGNPNTVFEYDAGTASGYMALQASLLGLVTHGMAGFDKDAARIALYIPDDFEPIAVYAIGKPGDKSQLPPQLADREIPSGRRPVRESIMEGGFVQPEEKAAEADTENDPQNPPVNAQNL